jgi:sugar phosphate isomerase/epimerase
MSRQVWQPTFLSRRRFLGRALCGAAAGALGGSLWTAGGPAAAAPPESDTGAASVGTGEKAAAPWTMRLSCSSINFSSLSIEQACQRIAALGFEAIDIWSAHAGCPHLDDVAKRLGPSGLKDLLARNQLKLYAFSVYTGGYPRYAELLGQAGGGVAVRGSAGPCKPDELVARMKDFLEALKPEIELAEKYGSYLAIENHGNALLHTLDSLKAFCDLNTNPRVGLALAPLHLQSIKAPVEEAIAVAGRQLFFFYAWQNAPDQQQLPGIGPTDFAPWLAALAKADYRWYVTPFMHHEPQPDAMSAALERSRDYLKKCAGTLPRLR